MPFLFTVCGNTQELLMSVLRYSKVLMTLLIQSWWDVTPYRCVNSFRLLQKVRCPIFRIWVAHENVLDSSDPEDGWSRLLRNLCNFTFRRGVMSQNTWIFSTLLLRILKIAPDWTGFFTQSLLPLESLQGTADTPVPRAGLEPTVQGRTATGTPAMYACGNTHSCQQYEVNVAPL